MESNTRIPNLFLLGAGKCGTTTLHKCLSTSKNIFGGTVKEPHFFSLGYEGRVGNWKTCDYLPNLDLYMENYHSDKNTKYLLDASASYLYYINVPKRILRYSRNPKFIIILRNPIDRCVSNYKMMRNLGLESRSFDQTIKDMHTCDIEYLTQGLYYHQLSNYFKYFDRKNFYVLIYEELFSGDYQAFERLLDWLNITDIDKEVILQTENKGENSIPLAPFLYKNLKYLRNFLPPQLPTKFLYPKKKFSLENNTKLFLTNYYHNDIKKLQSLLDIDLRCWS